MGAVRILAVDDESFALDALVGELCKVFPEGKIERAANAEDALAYADALKRGGEVLTYAFLDVNLAPSGINGIELARELKQRFPAINLFFCTAHSEYAIDAFALRAKGYFLKPISASEIEEVLCEMVLDWRTKEKKEKEVRIQTFGDFEVFVDGSHLVFERSKAKELLAYLVDRHGAAITTERIASILFPEDNYDRGIKNRVTAVISSLRSTLKKAGIEDVIVRSWNQLAVDTKRFGCDAYDYEKLDPIAVNSYRGEYMFGYEWAEFTTATYDAIKKNSEKNEDYS